MKLFFAPKLDSITRSPFHFFLFHFTRVGRIPTQFSFSSLQSQWRKNSSSIIKTFETEGLTDCGAAKQQKTIFSINYIFFRGICSKRLTNRKKVFHKAKNTAATVESGTINIIIIQHNTIGRGKTNKHFPFHVRMWMLSGVVVWLVLSISTHLVVQETLMLLVRGKTLHSHCCDLRALESHSRWIFQFGCSRHKCTRHCRDSSANHRWSVDHFYRYRCVHPEWLKFHLWTNWLAVEEFRSICMASKPSFRWQEFDFADRERWLAAATALPDSPTKLHVCSRCRCCLLHCNRKRLALKLSFNLNAAHFEEKNQITCKPPLFHYQSSTVDKMTERCCHQLTLMLQYFALLCRVKWAIDRLQLTSKVSAEVSQLLDIQKWLHRQPRRTVFLVE